MVTSSGSAANPINTASRDGIEWTTRSISLMFSGRGSGRNNTWKNPRGGHRRDVATWTLVSAQKRMLSLMWELEA